MAKIIVFSIGLLWACLLLISWGQADLHPPQEPTAKTARHVTSVPQR